ncbi:MAG: magnesium transporter [Rhodospirillaceae bacterium]|nr:magnesium transporter [Rhodospirillaceae bacterium]
MAEPIVHRQLTPETDETFGLDAAFVEEVAAGLRSDNRDRVRELVADLHYADMADLLERLDAEDRRLLVETVRDNFNPDVLPELAEEVRDEVMNALGFEDFAAALSELDSDDAVYVASKLTTEERAQVVARMPQAERLMIEQGLAYAEDSAGRLMQREFVAVPNYWTVGETIDYMRAVQNLPEKFYAVFVVDARNRPQGLVELSRLLRAKRPERMRDLFDEDVETIALDQDKEDVAFLFKQRNLDSAPVVDKSGRLVGQITIDDIVDVIEEEAEEDILKMAGVGNADVSSLYSAIIRTAMSRIPWLAINLVTAFLAASVVGLYEDSIAKLAALAVLMPIVAGMGGNAGTQALATAVRALATRELNASNALRVTSRELLVGLINGFLFAGVVGAIAYFWFQNEFLAIAIAAAMLINLTVAGFAGIMIPLTLNKLGVDPASAAGVFLTAMTDIVGFFTFLGLATLIVL